MSTLDIQLLANPPISAIRHQIREPQSFPVMQAWRETVRLVGHPAQEHDFVIVG